MIWFLHETTEGAAYVKEMCDALDRQMPAANLPNGRLEPLGNVRGVVAPPELAEIFEDAAFIKELTELDAYYASTLNDGGTDAECQSSLSLSAQIDNILTIS